MPMKDFINMIKSHLSTINYNSVKNSSKLIKIPVFYDSSVGFDLNKLLAVKKLTLNKFIELHSEREYLVYAVGFSSAFAFLATVNKRLEVPRLTSPRIKIPSGSVGIADRQTGVYPSTSSGGWNIIGRCPIDISLSNVANIKKFTIGDKVRFIHIDKTVYLNLKNKLCLK